MKYYERSREDIDNVLSLVGDYWAKYPKFRLGEFLELVFDESYDNPYFLEDSEIIQLFELYHEKNK